MTQVLNDERGDDITKKDELNQEHVDVTGYVAQLTWKIEKKLTKNAKREDSNDEKVVEKMDTLSALKTRAA